MNRKKTTKLFFASLLSLSSVAFLGGIVVLSSCSKKTSQPYLPNPTQIDHVFNLHFSEQTCIAFRDKKNEGFNTDQNSGRTVDLWYSKDGAKTWTEVQCNENGEALIVCEANETIYFAGNNPKGWGGWNSAHKAAPNFLFGHYRKKSIPSIIIKGSIMSLIGDYEGTKDTIPCQYCFDSLFASKGKPTTNWPNIIWDYNQGIDEVSANFLPAKKLRIGCYKDLFNGSNLSSIPDGFLPATELASCCYQSMFANCEQLAEVGEKILPSKSMSPFCYQSMFEGCKKLTTLPELPSLGLAPYCYNNMFKGTGVKEIPNNYLPALELAQGCYQGMFMNCGGLTSLSSDLLPATTIADSCYAKMFEGCNGIEEIPTKLLVAPKLAPYCYSYMFADTGIKHLKANIFGSIDELSEYCFANMFQKCDFLVHVEKNFLAKWNVLKEGCFWSMFEQASSNDCFEGFELPATDLAPYCYREMFSGSSIKSVPALEATVLKEGCYEFMFKTTVLECKEIKIAATKLVKNCCHGMFAGVTFVNPDQITVNLPAKQPGVYCYFNMFANSNISKIDKVNINLTSVGLGSMQDMFSNTKITEIPTTFKCVKPTEIVEEGLQYHPEFCYMGCFAHCHELTTINDDIFSDLTKTSNSYAEGMFAYCDKLQNICKIVFNSTGQSAFAGMFRECNSLTEIPQNKIKVKNVGVAAFDAMFDGCKNLKKVSDDIFDACLTFETDDIGAGVNCEFMFAECTSLVKPPKLNPNITVKPGCYFSMFRGCINLDVKIFKTTPEEGYTEFFTTPEVDFDYGKLMFSSTKNYPEGEGSGATTGGVKYYYKTQQ